MKILIHLHLIFALTLITTISSNALNSDPIGKLMAEFNCEESGNEIILDWFTHKDVEARTFVIERSNGIGGSFKEIGRIESPNHDEDILYVFVDEEPSLVNTYRIKLISEDGLIKYSEEKTIHSQADSELGKK